MDEILKRKKDNFKEKLNANETLDKFLTEYDAKDLQFNNTNYRQGARITCSFGLAQGYRKINGAYHWDSVRLHSGVDRSSKYNSAGNELKANVVMAPFNFNRCRVYDYGKEHVWGSLVRLFNDEYGFEMRIMHMQPEDIEIKDGQAIPKDTLIGPAGNYGSASDGAHTHTEFESLKNTCQVFDKILERQFGAIVEKEYTDIEIFNRYRSASYFKDLSPEDILEHYQEIKDKKKIVGVCNKFKFVYQDWFAQSVVTRYSSELLFNGL